MPRPLHIALIYGSTREGRFCDVVGAWTAARIAADGGFTLDVIDPAELTLMPHRHESEDCDEVRALRRRLARADGFVVATPEYNHSFPAVLKFVIDLVDVEWAGKPVAFVSYGGVSGGLRAVEQLRLVFAELHAVSVRDTVSFAGPWDIFDGTGMPRDDGRSARAMATMLDRLRWWASALRDARADEPFRPAA